MGSLALMALILYVLGFVGTTFVGPLPLMALFCVISYFDNTIFVGSGFVGTTFVGSLALVALYLWSLIALIVQFIWLSCCDGIIFVLLSSFDWHHFSYPLALIVLFRRPLALIAQ